MTDPTVLRSLRASLLRRALNHLNCLRRPDAHLHKHSGYGELHRAAASKYLEEARTLTRKLHPPVGSAFVDYLTRRMKADTALYSSPRWVDNAERLLREHYPLT